jgi:exodeoxyribonuclease-1
MITGITPQQTIADGITEAEFLRVFYEEIATPGTVFVGFNTVRFDDEFMRYMMWRNFYDAYEWQWQDNRSRWDLLDVVRMTRALRPGGIEWPFAPDGKPSNRLELLTSVNNLSHEAAHDALSDVYATIAVAQLIRTKQPKLFEYLLKMRDKKEIAKLVESNEPFVYTSGKYAAEFEKTTVSVRLGNHPRKKGALVYDLRHDPSEFLKLSPAELVKRWQWTREENAPKRVPVKTLQYNRCPAVAPVGVLDAASRQRLKLNQSTLDKHHNLLQSDSGFVDRLREALELMDKAQQTSMLADVREVDAQLYDGFVEGDDKTVMRVVRAADSDDAARDLDVKFSDKRLIALLPLYKARNFPKSLTSEEREVWESFRVQRLMDGDSKSRAARYFARLGDLANDAKISDAKRFLLEELQLWGQSILPYPE